MQTALARPLRVSSAPPTATRALRTTLILAAAAAATGAILLQPFATSQLFPTGQGALRMVPGPGSAISRAAAVEPSPTRQSLPETSASTAAPVTLATGWIGVGARPGLAPTAAAAIDLPRQTIAAPPLIPASQELPSLPESAIDPPPLPRASLPLETELIPVDPAAPATASRTASPAAATTSSSGKPLASDPHG